MEEICKHNQTGYCKFKEHCKKTHENIVCENTSDCRKENCIKRHPKVCKHFRAHGKCRHNAECAYQHVEQVNFQKLNEMVAQVIITNVKEINDLKQEVHELKTKMEDMEKYIKTMHNKINVSEKDAIKESTNVLYQCEECDYNCEDEVNLIQHKNAKHMIYGSKKPYSDSLTRKKINSTVMNASTHVRQKSP